MKHVKLFEDYKNEFDSKIEFANTLQDCDNRLTRLFMKNRISKPEPKYDDIEFHKNFGEQEEFLRSNYFKALKLEEELDTLEQKLNISKTDYSKPYLTHHDEVSVKGQEHINLENTIINKTSNIKKRIEILEKK